MGLSQRRTRLIGRLRVRKSRAKESQVLVEGVRACTEALDAGAALSFAVTSPRLIKTRGGGALQERLEPLDEERHEVSEEELAGLSDTEHPQGVLLVCQEPVASLDAVSVGGCFLVLDGVQDPGNVGTLVRAAVGFGLDGVVALDGTVDPWGAKSVRASAGMSFRVPVIRAQLGDAVAAFRYAGVPLVVGAGDGSPVAHFRAQAGFALLLGNEGAGVRAEVAEHADAVVAVPMRGPAESLNVGMAGSVLLYELTKESAT